MWRIAVLVPFPMEEESLKLRREQLGELGRQFADATFEYRPVKAAPDRLISAHDTALAELAVLEAGLDAVADGCDGICVDTVSDSGVSALRSVVDVPVVGPGRAAFTTALTLGHRFSVLAMWTAWFPL